MEQLWKRFTEDSERSDYDVKILNTLFFSPYKTLGEVREAFDTWTMEELEFTAQVIHYTPTDDEGVSEEYVFGERDRDGYHPFRECVLMRSHADTMWKLCSRKKKFF